MPRKSDSKKRMVRTMARLMQRQGYHATGLNQVVAESGAPKGSLYFHFPAGKDQLGSEAISSSGERLRGLIEAGIANARTPAAAVQAIAMGLVAGLNTSEFRDGCPIATVALEASATSEAIQSASETAFRSWVDTISRRFVELGMPESRAAQEAEFTLAAIEGGLLLSRTYRSTAPMMNVAQGLAARLEGK